MDFMDDALFSEALDDFELTAFPFVRYLLAPPYSPYLIGYFHAAYNQVLEHS